MSAAAEIVQILETAVPGAVLADVTAGDGMPTIVIDRAAIVDVCRTLRDHEALQFSFFVDVTAVDYATEDPRYHVVYHLACLGAAFAHVGAGCAVGPAAPPRRLRVKTGLPADDPRVHTVTGVYPAAGWPEREVFDLFGITFERHPDLRRILTADGWEGHPLRKDYPVQIRKDAERWSPIQLSVEEFAENMRADRERAARQAAPDETTRPSSAD
jgi:NADH-quinone oxidoreductase subunit C